MILTRTEYGTDGNVYELSISNGEEYKTQKMIPIDVLHEIRAEIAEQCNDICAEKHGCIDEVLTIIDKHLKEYEE